MIEIVEDLGMMYREGSKCNRKFHKYRVKCPICGKIFDTFEAKRIQMCKICGDKEAGKKRTIHGMWKHRLYSIYQSCKQRCYNPNHRQYNIYGGQGVRMCDEWYNSFEAFAAWALNNGYKDTLELDKDYLCEQLNIHPKIYSPQTCRWIPKSINAKSNFRQDSRSKLSYNDVKIILKEYKTTSSAKELAKRFNVDITTIYYNLKHFRLENNELQRI